MLGAGLLGSFPHGHTAAPIAAAAERQDCASHPPRPVRCLERDEQLETAACCALCFFQRTLSQGRVTPAASADTFLADRGIETLTKRFAVSVSVSPGDPRAPPAI